MLSSTLWMRKRQLREAKCHAPRRPALTDWPDQWWAPGRRGLVHGNIVPRSSESKFFPPKRNFTLINWLTWSQSDKVIRVEFRYTNRWRQIRGTGILFNCFPQPKLNPAQICRKSPRICKVVGCDHLRSRLDLLRTHLCISDFFPQTLGQSISMLLYG